MSIAHGNKQLIGSSLVMNAAHEWSQRITLHGMNITDITLQGRIYQLHDFLH